MIGRERPQLSRQLGAAAAGQLIGVHLGRKSESLSSPENAPGLLYSESGFFHEDIAARGELLPRDCRDHLVDQEIQVFRPIVPVLGRHHVGTEKGGDQTNRLLRCQAPVDPEQLELGLFIQTVATLALHRSDAESEHLLEESSGALHQLFLGCGPGLLDG
jgi:hypothetical protein